MEFKDIIATKVIEYYALFEHLVREDLLHTQQVVSFTRTIATSEGYTPQQIDLLEAAAWLHDIGCPKSKEIYGNSLPCNQQTVGESVAMELLSDVDMAYEDKLWICSVVASHHRVQSSISLNFTPLFEADFIVNALSGYFSPLKVKNIHSKMVTTRCGNHLLKMLSLI